MTEAEAKRVREILAEETAKFLEESREVILKRVEKRIKEEREKRIPTAELNRVITRITAKNPPPFHSGGNGKIFYFSPGHELYPIYHHPLVQRVIANAVRWAAPQGLWLNREEDAHVPIEQARERITNKGPQLQMHATDQPPKTK